MKPRFSNHRNRALTFIEVLVVIAGLAILAVLLLPVLAASKHVPQSINCVSNIKQISLAAHIWEGDNNNLYPMQVSVTNGGAMELIITNNIAGLFQVMSNELSTTKILICPQDTKVIKPTNGFGEGFCNKNTSYFVGVDANEHYPRRLMFGDDNFIINGAPVKSGLLQLSTNTPIAWGPGRHGDDSSFFHKALPEHFWGNLGFADGNVSAFSSSGLQQALQQTGLATNRLAIP